MFPYNALECVCRERGLLHLHHRTRVVVWPIQEFVRFIFTCHWCMHAYNVIYQEVLERRPKWPATSHTSESTRIPPGLFFVVMFCRCSSSPSVFRASLAKPQQKCTSYQFKRYYSLCFKLSPSLNLSCGRNAWCFCMQAKCVWFPHRSDDEHSSFVS